MITSLRKKFILAAMLSTFVVLAVIMGAVNILNYQRIVKRADDLIDYLAENDGVFEDRFPEGGFEQKRNTSLSGEEKKDSKFDDLKGMRHFNEETPFATRFFTVFLNEAEEVTEINIRKIASVDEQEAGKYVEKVIAGGKEKGFLDYFRYGYSKSSSGFLYIFVDCRQDMEFFYNVLILSIGVSSLGLFCVFLLVFISSRIVFQPVEESYRKQKQFITDASHELKTPLTIIDANTEVIEMTSGENQWTKSIRNQIHRLTELTNNLVFLSRLDEKGTKIEHEIFSLSDAVEEVIRPFEIIADQSGKRIIKTLRCPVDMNGDEKSIRQLIGILIDNALKYSLAESEIHVTLEKNGKWIIFTVDNPCQELPKELSKENMNILFDRFYRLDSSRNSMTGGSGIGLSIAQAIVHAHKGKISATSSDGKSLMIRVEFRIT